MTENPPVEETPAPEPDDDADQPTPAEPVTEDEPDAPATPVADEPTAPAEPVEPAEPAAPAGPAEPADPVETETIVLATPLPAETPESLAETGPETSLAIPCMVASIAAGAGMLVARRRAMGL
ncbi:hypothetical protein [Demequina sp. NBRC 110052]|uniref:hypothetical protein n=1 Tax=Demequina sp. NBRC 110052 TaxID=1570341 RepID=UPI00117D269F|nr:hypothetical protein [Demequina sp. NBRC 110052]